MTTPTGNDASVPDVVEGVCTACGSAVLRGEHIRDDLAPCFGNPSTSAASSPDAKHPVCPCGHDRLHHEDWGSFVVCMMCVVCMGYGLSPAVTAPSEEDTDDQ